MRRFSKITTTQLARICGVSQGTVDRALHNRQGINPETRKQILAVAREYDYVPNTRNSGLENSMLIGVVLFDIYNEFFAKLAMSLVNAARKVGYSVIFQFSGKDPKSERSALEYFDYIGVDGIVLFSAGSDSEEYANYLLSLKKPIVLIGNQMSDLPFVGIDDVAAMCELTERLVRKVPSGDILYYAPILRKDLNSTNAQRLRLEGFLQAITSLGRKYRIVTALEDLSDFGGIICSADYYAIQVLKYLNYPRDIKIAGFDNISLLKHLRTEVLTVDYSTDQIAKECINYILGKRFTPKIEHTLVDGYK